MLQIMHDVNYLKSLPASCFGTFARLWIIVYDPSLPCFNPDLKLLKEDPHNSIQFHNTRHLIPLKKLI